MLKRRDGGPPGLRGRLAGILLHILLLVLCGTAIGLLALTHSSFNPQIADEVLSTDQTED